MRYTREQIKTMIRNRPNKTARGMTETIGRGQHFLSGDALSLSVHGTCDSIARGRWLFITRAVCPCCGHKTGKFTLTEAGRRKLNRMRKAKA